MDMYIYIYICENIYSMFVFSRISTYIYIYLYVYFSLFPLCVGTNPGKACALVGGTPLQYVGVALKINHWSLTDPSQRLYVSSCSLNRPPARKRYT